MTRAKKILCRLMAFIMICGSVTIYRVQEVAAADYKLNFNAAVLLDHQFYPNTIRNSAISADMEKVLLSWPALYSGSTSMIGGTHNLSYVFHSDVYNADVIAEIGVTIEDRNTATVSYRLKNAATGIYIKLAEESGGTFYGFRNINHDNNTLVKERITTADMKNFTPVIHGGVYSEIRYTLPRGNGADPLKPEGLDLLLLDPAADLASTETTVEQVMLSWKGDGQTDASNRIYFQTDRAKDGSKIYSFKLNTAVTGATDEVHIASKFLDAVLGYPESGGIYHSVYTDVLDYENGGRTAQEPRAVFEFPIPQIWDWSANQYRRVDASDGISFYIDKSGDWTNPITVLNIASNSQGNEPVDYTYESVNGVGKLSMAFPESTIIANAKFFLDGKVKKEERTISETKFYTHLAYDIVEKASKFVAQIEPVYRNLDGANYPMTYRVYRKQQYGDSYLLIGSKSVDSLTENIWIDIEIPTLTGPYFYMVEAEDSQTAEIYRSQQMLYTMAGIDSPLKEPEGFTVNSVQTLEVDKDGLGDIQTYAKINFSFNAVNLVATKAQHPDLVEVLYAFLWHSLPKASYSDTDSKALTVRVDTSGTGPNFPAEILDENGVVISYATFNGVTEKIEGEALVPVKAAGDAAGDELSFPKTYYASVKATANVEISPGVYENVAEQGWAKETVLSINDIAPVKVPVPEGVGSENNTAGSFTVNFKVSLAEIFKYMDNKMNPHKETLSTDSVAYTMYFGEDFETLKAVSEKLAQGDAPVVESVVDVGDAPTADMKSHKLALEAGKVFGVQWNSKAGFAPTQGKRSQAYQYLDDSFIITGVNENTPYYAVIVTSLAAHDTQWATYTYLDGSMVTQYGIPLISGTGSEAHPVVDGDRNGSRYDSDPSSLITITTKGDVSGPTTEDVDPPAPENFTDIEVGARSARLGWSVIDEIKLANEIFTRDKIEYELVRVKDTTLPSEFINNKNPMSEIQTYLQANFSQYEYAGWRTQGTQSAMLEIFNTMTSINGMSFLVEQARNVVVDGDLIPSSMYVYYVRTVLKNDNGTPIKYSVWVPYSVSTSPVEKPLNLKVLRTGNFDSLTQGLISFDAFVSRADLTTGDYEIHYSIKKDGEDWSENVVMPASALMGGTVILDDPENYYNYEYLIKGLKTGSSYMVRVQIRDTRTGDLSMWSNTETIRTQVDPDDPTEDIGKWEDYLKQQLEALLKNPYWQISSGTTSIEAVYRTSMFDGVIGQASNNVIVLGRENDKTQNYYIPIESVTKAVSTNNGFKIVVGDVTLLIPSDVITAAQSETLKAVAQKIKENSFRDYYIHITVNTVTATEKIDGNDALSDKIDLKIAAVGFSKLERTWDGERLTASKALIEDADMLASNRTKISNKIKAGTSDEEMVKYIATLVEAVEKKIISANKSSFNSHKKTSYAISDYENPVRIILSAATTDTEISGYHLVSGKWEKVTAQPYMNGKSILVTASGTYIFAGFTIVIPGLEGMTNSGAIREVVIKYQLYDFFGADGVFNTEAALTNNALIGSVARMAGATSTQDAATYLRDKGIAVSVRNGTASANNEITVYLVMSLYEIKTNTKVSAVRITNQNILNAKGITGVNASYVPHYKVAYQSGIIEKAYQPKAQMQVKDFLEIIGHLAAKTNL